MGGYRHSRQDRHGKYSDRVLANHDRPLAQPETIHVDQMNGSGRYLQRHESQLYVVLQLNYRILLACQFVGLHCDNQQRHNHHRLVQMDRTGSAKLHQYLAILSKEPGRSCRLNHLCHRHLSPQSCVDKFGRQLLGATIFCHRR